MTRSQHPARLGSADDRADQGEAVIVKNQYFGDINDYLKYGLLRTISQATGLRIAVCWMLTPPDPRPDGGKTAYLNAPAVWRHYDPELFDVLKDAVACGRRNITVAETGRVLPGAVYHSDILQGDQASRLRIGRRTRGVVARHWTKRGCIGM